MSSPADLWPIDPRLLTASQSSEEPRVTLLGSTPAPETVNGRSFDGTQATDSPSSCGPIRTSKRPARQSNTGPSLTDGQADTYVKLSLLALRASCKEHRLRTSGNKADLIQRLKEYDRSKSVPIEALSGSPSDRPTGGSLGTLSSPLSSRAPSPSGHLHPVSPYLSSNPGRVLDDDATALTKSFEVGLRGLGPEEDEDEDGDEDDDGNESDGEDEGDEEESVSITDPAAVSVLKWVDEFILQTRRKSGRKTESSVLAQWKRWATTALKEGTIPDLIIDANHAIQYLQYAATRKLFTKRGVPMSTNERLSASSLKKIMTMLGRVRRRQVDDNPDLDKFRPASSSRSTDFYKAVMIQAQRQRLEVEDFDVAKNTILDQEIRPGQIKEITEAVFGLNQIPSIVKAHFAWSWQMSTLNRSDELLGILLSRLQPYHLQIPDYRLHNGRVSGNTQAIFGVLTMWWQTKTAKPGKSEPVYSFVLPHRDPLRCPIGALAILLHYKFDQQHLCTEYPGWNWAQPSTWRSVSLMFGKTVKEPLSGDGLTRMYGSFLDNTSITAKKKTHLARKTMPTILEDMGVPPDQVDAAGNWVGGTRQENYTSKIPKLAVAALAGFPVGEAYCTPWTDVPVPEDLQRKIFPFAESALAALRAAGSINKGAFNFLELLQKLRPFFWRAIAAIKHDFPQSGITKRLRIYNDQDGQSFLNGWSSLLRIQVAKNNAVTAIASTFHETPTQNAFTSISSRMQNIEHQVGIIARRTEPLSPSKQRTSAPAGRGLITPQLSSPLFVFSAPQKHTSRPPSIGHDSTPVHDVRMSSPPPIQLSSSSLTPPIGCPPVALQPIPPISLSLIPTTIACPAGKYDVLPLSPRLPTQAPIHTAHDMILPPRNAFHAARYPEFSLTGCTWQTLLSYVTCPSVLWETYAPKALGDYPTVEALWEAWDEGSYVSMVGRLPPLRLIDEKWGNRKNQSTGKGKFPLWRPRSNDSARTKWSKFHFFVERIEARKKEGESSDTAVKYFDNQRGSRSVNALYTELRPKKAKSLTTTSTVTVPPSMDMEEIVPTGPSAALTDVEMLHPAT